MSVIVADINATRILKNKESFTIKVFVELACGIISSASFDGGEQDINHINNIIAPTLINMSMDKKDSICNILGQGNLNKDLIFCVSSAIQKAMAMHCDTPMMKRCG